MRISTFILIFLLGIWDTVSFAQTDIDFNVFISDAGNFATPPWQILKFDKNGENPEVFTNTNLGWPQDILILSEENVVLISNLTTGTITKYDLDSGEFLGNFATGIAGPTRMKIGPDGFLYVLQWNGNGKVRHYNLDGTYLGEFTSVGVPQSIGIAWDSNDNLYVSSYNGDHVRQFDQSGNDLGLFINSNLLGPTNIWFDGSDLLVCDYDGSSVKRFDFAGSYKGDYLTGLSNAEGIAKLPNGNIIVGNGGSNSVRMYDSDGNYLEDFIGSGSGNLLTPNAVLVQVIRDGKGPSSISKPYTTLEKDLVYPTMGQTFYLQADSPRGVLSVEIYNISGKLIESRRVKSSLVWDAKQYAKGTYMLLLKSEDKYVGSQKVIVGGE